MKKRLVILIGCSLFAAVFAFGALRPPAAHANFNQNSIIDDYTFDNAGTMSAGQIDAFLNAFGGSCISPNHGFTALDPTGYSPGGGFTYGAMVSAGTVIAHAATTYGINPQVLLTTLQKEQSLVTGGGGCDILAYSGAVGYGCPDGGTTHNYSGLNLYAINGVVASSVNGTCVNTAAKTGFSQQVIRGAWLLKFGEQRSEGNTGWAIIKGNWNNSDDPATCYGGPMTQGSKQRCQGDTPTYFDGYTTIDGTAVHMDNGATAALYWYTPHFSGNQHFDTIFESWFGSTHGDGYALAISDNTSDTRQWVIYGSIKQLVPDPDTKVAWGLDNVNLVTMPAAQLNAITTGPNLARLYRINGGSTYYFVDSGKRYTLPSLEYINTWHLNGMVISSVSTGLGTVATEGGLMTDYVQRTSGTTKYMLDGASGAQTVFRPYASDTVFTAIEGVNAQPMVISDGLYSFLNVTNGSTLTNARFSNSGNQFMATDGTKRQMVGAVQTLYPGAAQPVSNTTIARLDTGPDMMHLIRVNTTGTTYMIDGGTKHLIADPNVLAAWRAPNTYVVTVSPGFATLIPDGAALNVYSADASGTMYLVNYYKTVVPAALDTAYRTALPPFSVSALLMNSLIQDSGVTLTRFFQVAGTPSVYLLDNSGNKHLIDTADKLTLWGGYVYGTPLISGLITNSIPTASGTMSVYVNDGTNDYVMSGGKRLSVSAAAKTEWGLGSPQVLSDGTLSGFATNGALNNKFDMGNAFYIVKQGTSYGSVDPNIGDAWGIRGSAPNDVRLISALITHYSSLTRIVRSSGGSNYTMYLVDKNIWHKLWWNQFLNLGGLSLPMMILAPDSSTVTDDWKTPVVKADNGNYFAIDSGGVRTFPAQMIIDQWTNWRSLAVVTLSNNYINSLPYRGIVERTVKGSAPAVYTVINSQKRWILYPDTYNRLYAPYIVVGDPLINALDDGPSI